MAKIVPIQPLVQLSGRADRRSDLIYCTNHRTGTVYTVTRPRSQSGTPSSKQLQVRDHFSERMRVIKQWSSENAPGCRPDCPQGTPSYLRLRNAFLEQTEVKSMMGFLWRNITAEGVSKLDIGEE
jgi:hypothetical protein